MSWAELLRPHVGGEGVGGGGDMRESELVERPPHPEFARRARKFRPLHSPSKTGVNALTASGERLSASETKHSDDRARLIEAAAAHADAGAGNHRDILLAADAICHRRRPAPGAEAEALH